MTEGGVGLVAARAPINAQYGRLSPVAFILPYGFVPIFGAGNQRWNVRRLFKWTGIAFAALFTPVALFWLFGVYILEIAVDLTCSDPQTVACQARMRALGHLWSGSQNLPRAMTWYQRAANAGDASAMFHLGWMYLETAKLTLPSLPGASLERWLTISPPFLRLAIDELCANGSALRPGENLC